MNRSEYIETSKALIDLQVQIECIKDFLVNHEITSEQEFLKACEEKYNQSPYREIKSLQKMAENI